VRVRFQQANISEGTGSFDAKVASKVHSLITTPTLILITEKFCPKGFPIPDYVFL
jgi:hypothetical protein